MNGCAPSSGTSYLHKLGPLSLALCLFPLQPPTGTGFLSWYDIKDSCGPRSLPGLHQTSTFPPHPRACITVSPDPNLEPLSQSSFHGGCHLPICHRYWTVSSMSTEPSYSFLNHFPALPSALPAHSSPLVKTVEGSQIL